VREARLTVREARLTRGMVYERTSATPAGPGATGGGGFESRRPDLHQRFRTVVARGIARADREEREHLAALRPESARVRRRGRRRGGEITLGSRRTA
jgi:hypothetical protein